MIYSKAKPTPKVDKTKARQPSAAFTIIGWMFLFIAIGGYSLFNWYNEREKAKQAKIDQAQEIEEVNALAWRYDLPDVSVLRSITKSEIRGCGSLKWKQLSRNKFLVACTRDDIKWQGYLVYPGLETAIPTNREYTYSSSRYTY